MSDMVSNKCHVHKSLPNINVKVIIELTIFLHQSISQSVSQSVSVFYVYQGLELKINLKGILQFLFVSYVLFLSSPDLVSFFSWPSPKAGRELQTALDRRRIMREDHP